VDTRRVQEAGRLEIAAAGRALAWVGGDLYDIAEGWRRFALDGSKPESRFSGYGSNFDAVVVSPGRDVAALVQSTGTKGLIMGVDGRVAREVNRSYYHAEVYRYPLALFSLSGGRTGVVHCPERYNRLEIEDAITGERLTASSSREPKDFFHSRLAVSPSGRWLLSAGWVWQPFDWLAVYDLQAALADPRRLDSYGDPDQEAMGRAEIAGACFVGDDVIVATAADSGEPHRPGDLGPAILARWSTAERQYLWQHRLDQTGGDLVPIAGGVLALFHHPRLYDVGTGNLESEWPDLTTGEAGSSIVWDKAFTGTARIAVDELRHRFAVTDGQKITIITLTSDQSR
jgi:hypothetical protein